MAVDPERELDPGPDSGPDAVPRSVPQSVPQRGADSDAHSVAVRHAAPGRAPVPELELAGWRREVSMLYAAVRAEKDPERGHAIWRAGRDELFRRHPQSPLPPGDPMRETGVPYWPYDPQLRFEPPLRVPADPADLSVPTDGDGQTSMRLVGRVELPEPIGATLDVWWLRQYAGGLFVPLRDGTAGAQTYGGGRYLLDTAKGADLGGDAQSLVFDLNFLYHPSCRYDVRWQCPLAPAGNTISVPIRAGERLRFD